MYCLLKKLLITCRNVHDFLSEEVLEIKPSEEAEQTLNNTLGVIPSIEVEEFAVRFVILVNFTSCTQ